MLGVSGIAHWHSVRRGLDGFSLFVCISTGRIQLVLTPHPSRTLQFLIAPLIGTLSDKYGRRNVLLITMAGNILSALV